MEKYEEESRRKKTFRAKHNMPGDFQLDYILLPYGYAYNSEWQEAKYGDTIRFWDGEDRRIFSVRKLKIKSPEADILSRLRYGITMKGTLARWKSNARLEGNLGRAVSDDICFWVIFDKAKEDEETDGEE